VKPVGFPLRSPLLTGLIAWGLLPVPGFLPPAWAGSEGGIEVTMEVEGGAAYRRQPLQVALNFINREPDTVTIDDSAFEAGAFEVIDARGRVVPQAAGRESTAPIAAYPETLAGYGSVREVVDISRWYPKLTRKRGDLTITWNHAGLAATSLQVRVIDAYDPVRDTTAIIETPMGSITWELLPQHAPEHVKRFVDLARQGHYDGLTFFRYIPQLLVEGGDPAGDGTGAWMRLMGPEIVPDLVPGPGFVGAARRETSMTSDTMFFVTLFPAVHMQGKHTFYARVVRGYEILARMNLIERVGGVGQPGEFLLREPVRIEGIRIK